MESIKKITSNFLPPHKRKINITLSHKKSYNSCATYSDCASIILAFTSRTLVKIANSFGIPIHDFLDNIIEHYSQETEINPESIEAKNKIFELSNYVFKYSIYSHNLLLNSELSTISRQSKKHILLIPVFAERNIFLAIIEYNNATREILNIYMTLPKFNIEDEKGKILSTISQFFSKGAYVFSSDFTQKNIVIVDFELQEGSQIDSNEICQAFLLSFSMGNVVV